MKFVQGYHLIKFHFFLGTLCHEEKPDNNTDAGFAAVEESSIGKRTSNRGE